MARGVMTVTVSWAGALGPARLFALETDRRTMVPGEPFRLDVPGWFGS